MHARYWCEGSKAKALQLVMATIERYGLKDQVVEQLGAKKNQVNNEIMATHIAH